MVDSAFENNTLPLTIMGAITLRQLEGNEFAQRQHLRMSRENRCFSQQLYGDVCEQKGDYYDLGSDWTRAQEDLHNALAGEWFRKKHPERVKKILEGATEGLRQLDPRFGEVTLDVLMRHPELVYIGLVQLHIQNYPEEKRMVTDYHRHFLVVRDMRAA